MIKRITENILFITIWLLISTIIYFFHYIIFGDLRQTLSGIILSLGYVPIGIIYQELIVDKILDKKQKLNSIEKINVIIGAFYNEVGNSLINILSKGDKKIDIVREEINVNSNWSNEKFQNLIELLKVNTCEIDINKIDIRKIVKLLNHKDTLIINLMINQNIKEYKGFIQLLIVLIYLRDQLQFVTSMESVDDFKYKTIKEEVCKSYNILLIQWVLYIKELKDIDYDLFLKVINNSPLKNN